MKHASLALVVVTGVAGLMPLPGHAGTRQLSPERLDALDRYGCFPPDFKAAVHNLVDARRGVEEAKAEQVKLTRLLPDLNAQATEADAKTAALREELAKYDHPEETDFLTLQARMNDTTATPEEQISLAQAYVWAYAASPHEADAQRYLQQVQKKLADQRQAGQDAEAARVAARARLIQRVQARDLSLDEWRDFLRDRSQAELLKYLGPPDSKSGNYWIYSRAWITDPTTRQKVGMEINFSGGRVLSVFETPSQ